MIAEEERCMKRYGYHTFYRKVRAGFSEADGICVEMRLEGQGVYGVYARVYLGMGYRCSRSA